MRFLITGGSGFIGSNLIDDLQHMGVEILNIDIKQPQVAEHLSYWHNQNILDRDGLARAVAGFQPTHLIHLAARADTDGLSLSEYAANIEGSANVLHATSATTSVALLVMTSTQFVYQNEGVPRHDMDFAPHTVYGESKVIMERLTRDAKLGCDWTVIRPTNIWGPLHPRYPVEFWRVLDRGFYFHPSVPGVVRSYGYVKNVTWQIMKLCFSRPELVSGRVFYVGDEPVELVDWVNAFATRMTGRKVRIVPRSLLRGLAMIGDTVRFVGLPFPLTSSRLRSMTTSNPAPMHATMQLCGPPPFSLDQGADQTVKWLRTGIRPVGATILP